jgi:hypothetical protein
VNNEGLHQSLWISSFYVLVAILQNFSELIQSEFASALQISTFSLVSQLFNPDDPFDLSPFQFIEPIAEELGRDSRLLDGILAELQGMEQTPNVRFYESCFWLV